MQHNIYFIDLDMLTVRQQYGQPDTVHRIPAVYINITFHPACSKPQCILQQTITQTQ